MKRLVLLAALLASTAIAQDAPVGVDTAAIDRSIKPGDDFDAYANGAWRATTEIPADRSSTGVFLTVFKKAEAANAAIIKTAGAAHAATGTDQRRIADYYAAFMDTAGIEARGMAPVQADLAAIAALKDKTQLSAMLGANLRADEDPINATSLGTENLFGLFVTQALTKPDATVPYVLQGGLGMPDRDYYLSTAADMVAIRTAYRR